MDPGSFVGDAKSIGDAHVGVYALFSLFHLNYETTGNDRTIANADDSWGSFAHTVSITVVMSGAFGRFNVLCK